jgi:DNA-binding NtrC family response regulator
MGNPLRVLIVEDSETDALLLLRELRRGGYEPAYLRVDSAESLDDALDKMSWDIVSCDFKMPAFDGASALALFKRKQLDIPFIIVSGMIGEDMAVDMMKAGAHDYLLKDKLARLIPAIERELREAEERRQHRKAEEARSHLAALVASSDDAIEDFWILVRRSGESLPGIPYFTTAAGLHLGKYWQSDPRGTCQSPANNLPSKRFPGH